MRLMLAVFLVLSSVAVAAGKPTKAPPPPAPAPTKGEPRAPLGILTTPAEIEKAKDREPERDRESLDSPPSESYDSSSSSDD